MYPTRLYLFWNTIPSLKIPSYCGYNIAEYNLNNCTRQNQLNANLTFKILQDAQNAQNTFSTFCWCAQSGGTGQWPHLEHSFCCCKALSCWSRWNSDRVSNCTTSCQHVGFQLWDDPSSHPLLWPYLPAWQPRECKLCIPPKSDNRS